MKKVFAVFVLLIFFCACKPNKADETEIAWDTTRYELYDELLFGRFYHTRRVLYLTGWKSKMPRNQLLKQIWFLA